MKKITYHAYRVPQSGAVVFLCGVTLHSSRPGIPLIGTRSYFDCSESAGPSPHINCSECLKILQTPTLAEKTAGLRTQLFHLRNRETELGGQLRLTQRRLEEVQLKINSVRQQIDANTAVMEKEHA